jgi:pimeloyl-ACP methyl ester carboxylesterase
MTRADAARPFTVEIGDERLGDLRARLRNTRWATDFGNDDWRYGVERGWLEGMVRYWAEEFDWRAQEAAINRFPQYRVEIDGIPLHFVHVRGRGPDPLPLILTHGWPWTFWDWKDVIGPLTDPAAHGGDPADCFDVIVPSLPGTGFSTPLTTTGVNARRVAQLWVALMRDVLGYDRFCAGGSDWGAIVTAELGHAHPEHLIGVWLTLPMLPGVNLRELAPEAFAPDEQWMVRRVAEARPLIQSHRTVHQYEPQTIAYALADSPTGTAAWIWARRRDWSDCGGDVLTVFDRDFLCTTASIYWLTGTIATSLRLYHEHFNPAPPPPLHTRRRVIDVPTGFSVMPRDLLMMPRAVAAELTDLRHWSVLTQGGHFAASEQPQAIVEELRAFYAPLREQSGSPA